MRRRMLSTDIIRTDDFLDMSLTTQALYMHLNIEADDDGFVSNPKTLVRMLGAAQDDMKTLIAKKFVIPFENRVCVLKHWKINNYIRKDIYKETKYLEYKKGLFIRENGAYTQTNDKRALPVPKGHFQLETINVDDTCTLRAPSIDKVSIDKNRERVAVATPPPFVFSKYLKEMDNNKDTAIQLIAHFFRVKSLNFSTLAETQMAIKRHLRASRQVIVFERKKVFDAIRECQKMERDGVSWTLETTLKVLTK